MAFEINITLSDDGQFNISAPFDNQIICYGMLAHAHDVIKAAAEGAIEAAPPKPTLIPVHGSLR